MAFNHKNFSVIAHANGFTLWQYKTTDNSEIVLGDKSYFGDVACMMAVGDIILLNCGNMSGFRVVEIIEGKLVKFGELQ